ncbi:hypothetical protein BG844_11010 [Couchioplanes caeruleus subsp. caeruleus]|uniref:Uncharacterized protein n=1 Tax=Couchioplanes caeruleus subsp. caeruleus TaxID=56427 RepID=A0A1K0GXM1_9ACTN|nr:hypothetical protein BG844_11010 [Couchioplanes caeruleus subsp. caeruleus]
MPNYGSSTSGTQFAAVLNQLQSGGEQYRTTAAGSDLAGLLGGTALAPTLLPAGLRAAIDAGPAMMAASDSTAQEPAAADAPAVSSAPSGGCRCETPH